MKNTMHRALAALAASGGLLLAGVSVAPDSARATVSTVTETAVGDTYVSSSDPAAVHATSTKLYVGAGATTYKTYVKFDLTDRTGTLTAASLRLHTLGSGSGSAGSQTVSVTSGSWSESTLTYRNAPASGTSVGTLAGPSSSGTTYRVPLSISALQSAVGGTLSLVITQKVSDNLVLASRETTTPPRLSLSLDDGATSTGGSTSGTASTEAAVVNGWGAPVAGDEFNYTGAPDSTKWSVYNSAGHAGNGLRSRSQVTVNGSALRITGDAHGTTGGMSQRFNQTYGKWEARMRVSPGRDTEYHPVLILWPQQGSGTANNCAEMDYAESTKTVDNVSFFLHHSCSGAQAYASQTLDMTRWHNYAIEWRAGTVRGYIDGVKYFESTDASQIPDDPAHQTIQLDWFPDGTTTTPSWMEVDWVRVYR
ncbi:MAG: hypothetical protein JWN91_1144 [Nocardioides sp.]|jgi:hypothetical protein|nr:hypothetical protein [Nocardioides sp.]